VQAVGGDAASEPSGAVELPEWPEPEELPEVWPEGEPVPLVVTREGDDGRIRWRYDAQGIKEARLNADASRVVDLWPVIERIAVPTLVVRGERSDFCPADVVAEMQRRNPCISSVCVSGAGHYVHDDDPRAFGDHVAEFLTGMQV
jgi:pimeloyl-ACP methyl ester carboxylesterase